MVIAIPTLVRFSENFPKKNLATQTDELDIMEEQVAVSRMQVRILNQLQPFLGQIMH